MPHEKDHCRSCGADVDLGSADGPATGRVCKGCKKTVCDACAPKSCPHPSFARNPGVVSESEHAALKAQFSDPEALLRRLNELRVERGETPVGF